MTGLICIAVCLAAGSPELREALDLLGKLDRTIMTVDYRDQTVQAIVEDLDGRLPVRLRVDWPGLDAMDVKASSRVTLRVSEASATTVLSGLALLLGNDFGRVVAEPFTGQIVLTSSRGSAGLRFTEFYDVRDLIAREVGAEVEPTPAPDAPTDDGKAAPRQEPDAAPAAPAAPGGKDAGDDADPSPKPAAPARPSRRGRPPNPNVERLREVLAQIPPQPNPSPVERLMLTLTDHVDPDAWIRFGGDRAEYSEREGVIILTAPAGTHRRFAGALAQFRAAHPSSLAIEAEVVALPAAVWQRLRSRFEGEGDTLARQVRAAPELRILWSTQALVVLGQTCTAGSSSEAASVRLQLQPVMDEGRGLLTMAMQVSVVNGVDRREVQITVTLPPAPAPPLVVVELPAPGDDKESAITQLLFITARGT